MTYADGSNWTDKFELECLLIFRKCEAQAFPRGLQLTLCNELVRRSENPPSAQSLSAKVGNFKSLAGINNASNYSKNSKRIFDLYQKYSIEDLEATIIGNSPLLD